MAGEVGFSVGVKGSGFRPAGDVVYEDRLAESEVRGHRLAAVVRHLGALRLASLSRLPPEPSSTQNTRSR